MSWRDRPMLGFDLETTGIDVETASIVTACAGVASRNGWSPRNWILTQAEPIPAEATSIHGITTEYANEYGRDPRDVLPEIVEQLYLAWDAGYPIVGHNVGGYDLTVLDRNLRRHSLPPLEVRGPVIDTLVSDWAASKWRKRGACTCGRCGGSRTLIDVCAHHGIKLSLEDAHGAEQDALASCRLAWKLGADWVHLDAVHDVQRAAYVEQQDYYIRRAGQTPDAYNTAWPLRPLPEAQPQLGGVA